MVMRFFVYFFGAPRVLRSFPTRRSSDLAVGVVVAAIAFFAHGGAAELATPDHERVVEEPAGLEVADQAGDGLDLGWRVRPQDRKSTRLNSSHTVTSYAVFCLKKKKKSVR